MRKAVVAVLSVQVALTCGFLLALRSGAFPLGVAGRMEWLRSPRHRPVALQWVIGASAVLGYALFAGWGMRVLATSLRPWEEAIAVASLVVASLVTQGLVATAAPEGYGLAKWILALHNPGSSGYYTVAKQQIQRSPAVPRRLSELDPEAGCGSTSGLTRPASFSSHAAC